MAKWVQRAVGASVIFWLMLETAALMDFVKPAGFESLLRQDAPDRQFVELLLIGVAFIWGVFAIFLRDRDE
jgi:hypothetical protein